MIGTIEAIYNILSGDNTLVNMLGFNKPFYNPKGTSAKVNSIVPADIVETALESPFVVIQEGSELKIGTTLGTESVFIRCYNDRRKSYITINQILDRVKGLLDDTEFIIDDKTLVKIAWEATMPGLIDESLNLKFKELRFRLLVL